MDALAISASTVFAGGTLTSIGGARREGAAAIDTQTGRATMWNPDVGVSSISLPDVRAVLAINREVYIAGDFQSVGGRPRTEFAREQMGGGDRVSVKHHTGFGEGGVTPDCNRLPSGRGGDLEGAAGTAQHRGGAHSQSMDVVTESAAR